MGIVRAAAGDLGALAVQVDDSIARSPDRGNKVPHKEVGERSAEQAITVGQAFRPHRGETPAVIPIVQPHASQIRGVGLVPH